MIRLSIPVLAALALASCTYAPRSTKIDNTYSARQMAVGVGDQTKDAMTSTTSEEPVTPPGDNRSSSEPRLVGLRDARTAPFERTTNNLQPAIVESNYLTIGSTKSDVVRIQGTPNTITKFDSWGEEWWFYGYSKITLKNGRVHEWNNHGNLKVRM
jgi:hypothetical protein